MTVKSFNMKSHIWSIGPLSSLMSLLFPFPGLSHTQRQEEAEEEAEEETEEETEEEAEEEQNGGEGRHNRLRVVGLPWDRGVVDGGNRGSKEGHRVWIHGGGDTPRSQKAREGAGVWVGSDGAKGG